MNIKYIHIVADTKIGKIDEIHIKNLPYFIELGEKYPDYGTKEKPFRLDVDKKLLEHLIDYLRNGEEYDFPKTELSILDRMYESQIDLMEEFIKLNVGGNIFYTTKRTLSKCGHFESLFRWNDNIPEYIDRNGKIFQKILRHLRCPEYIPSAKYKFEMDYFSVKCNETSMAVSISDIEPATTILENFDDCLIDQDKYLSGNPQITHFKTVYRRHTNFFSGTNETKGVQTDKQITFNLDLNPNIDLLSEMWILLVPTASEKKIYLSDVVDIKFIVNDTIIEYTSSKIINMYMKLINHEQRDLHLENLKRGQLYLPLHYVFNNPNLSLPVLSIHNKFRVDVAMTTNLKYTSHLYYLYFSLTSDEKKRFRKVHHEYLYNRITDHAVVVGNICDLLDDKLYGQTSHNSTSYNYKLDLPFDGSIRWLIIEINPVSDKDQDELLNYAKIFIKDKFITMTTPLIAYASLIRTCKNKKNVKNLYLIPFCLNILEHQPTGSLTVGEGLRAELNINCPNAEIIFYAMYNNVLKVNNIGYNYIYDFYSHPGCSKKKNGHNILTRAEITRILNDGFILE